MNPTVSQNWGNPEIVQRFRSDALSKGLGVQTVDSYIQQMQEAFKAQSGHQVQGAIGQAQGAMTSGQAQQDPTAALNFLKGGGQLVPAGPDAQAAFINQTQKLFNSSKDKGGYVSPDLYNKTKEAASALNIPGETFDSTFAKGGYVNPNKIINYNTTEGQANQQAYGQLTRQIGVMLDKYHNIPADQRGVFSKAQASQIPIIGQLIAPSAYSYETSRAGLSAQLKAIAGAGANSGVRVTNTELDRWANLLPNASDSPQVAQKNIDTINNEIKATFNTSEGLPKHYLQSGGRPSLSSFQQ